MRDLVWVNGALDGRVDPFDRGVTLGDGVFDTALTLGGTVFAGERHLARLLAQADAIGIAVPADAVRTGWSALQARAGDANTILRTTVTRGRSGRGLWPGTLSEPTVIVSATPWDARLFGAPARLSTSSVPRNSASPLARLKTLNYLDNVLAAREAAAADASDALLLNLIGNVACTTIANVFAVIGDELVTPPLADGVLAGVVRSLVIQAAPAAGLRPSERSLAARELASADAAFLTNSVRFIAPVAALDGRAVGNPEHPAVPALADALAAEVQRQCGVDLRSVMRAHSSAAGRQ